MAIILWSLGGQVCLSFLIELGTDAILMSHNKGKKPLFGVIDCDPFISRNFENCEICPFPIAFFIYKKGKYEIIISCLPSLKLMSFLQWKATKLLSHVVKRCLWTFLWCWHIYCKKKTVGFIEFSLMLRAEGNMKSKPFGLTTHGNGKMLRTTTFRS